MALLRVLVLLVFLVPGLATAQASRPGRWDADLSLALSRRAGGTTENDFTVTYGGRFSPTHLRLGGAYYPFAFPFGLRGEARLEGFQISGAGLGGAEVGERASNYFLSLGPSWEWTSLGWLRVEVDAGYGLSAIPLVRYDSSKSGRVASDSLGHHGLVLGARAEAAPWGPLRAAAWLRTLPFAFGAELEGKPASASQLFLGVGVGAKAFQLWGANLVPMLEYELAVGRGGASELGLTSTYVFHRVGLTARFGTIGAERRPGAPTGPGRIRGRVLADAYTPIAGAELELPGVGKVTSDQRGNFVLPDVPPGTATVDVRAGGYRPQQQTVTVAPETDAPLTVTLVKKTGPGSIKGRVVAAAAPGKEPTPITGAHVRVTGGALVTTAADGTFTLPDVGPGPVPLTVSARGYKAAEEIVSVPPETETEVAFTVVKTTAQQLATIRGQVRSAKGGKGVPATLRIPEAQVSTRAGADGRFSVRVPGGRYTVVFSASGFVAQTKTVDVADGDQALFYVDLSPSER